MDYYLKNLREDKCWFLGSDADLNVVAGEIIRITNNGANISNRYAILEDYNQTGKDEKVYSTFVGYWRPLCHNLELRIPQYHTAWALRPWLVVDENGRHIDKATVKDWLDHFVCVPHRYYWGCAPDAVRGRRWNWPALRRGTNIAINDPDLKAEVEEVAGSRTASKMFSRKLEGWRDIWGDWESKACRRRPHKSWKQKKCKRQWQRYKKCGQMPCRPVPAEAELDELSDNA